MSSSAATRISKNTSALLLGMGSRSAMTLIFVVYLARVVGVEKFGQYALARQYFELFLGLGATAVGILITRRIAQRPQHLNQCVTGAAIIVATLATASMGVLYLLVTLLPYSDETRVAIYVAALSLIPAVLAAILEATFVAIEKAGVVTLATALTTILFVSGGVVVVQQGYGVVVILTVFFLSRTFSALFYLAALRREVGTLRWKFDGVYLRGMIGELRVYALENWCSTLNNHLGLILLSAFHSEFVVGLFAAAARVVNAGNLLATSYTRAVFPYLARMAGESNDAFQRVSQGSVKYMLMLVLPFIIAASVFADRLVTLVFSDAYASATNVLRVLVWVILVRFVNPFLSHALFARGEQIKSLRVAAIRLGVYCVAALLLIPSYDALGAAWAGLTAATAAFCIYYVSVFQLDGPGFDLAMVLLRTLAAGLLSALLLLLAPAANLPAVLGVSAATYVLLLFSFRVVTWNELRLVHRLR